MNVRKAEFEVKQYRTGLMFNAANADSMDRLLSGAACLSVSSKEDAAKNRQLETERPASHAPAAIKTDPDISPGPIASRKSSDIRRVEPIGVK